MKIEVGKSAGFCKGVELCLTKLDNIMNTNSELYCLGEVVHNKDVVNNLISKGLIVVNEISEVPNNAKLVIRAHGAEKWVYDDAKKRNIEIFDLTCPKVLSVRNTALNYLDDNTFIVLIAQKNHPEAKSTISFCGKNSIIVEDVNDVLNAINTLNKYKRVLVIGQTTFSESKFNTYSNLIKDKLNNDVVVVNTICLATSTRQNETIKLAKEKDLMIIIGGKNSSNTKKLYEIALDNCPKTIWIENEYDLDVDINDNLNIGIMAGASTPDYVINNVVKKISKDNKNTI